MTELDLPEILNIPPKLYPMLTDFNKYKYFLLVGGRGSSKTQSIARLIAYLMEQRKIRVVCGREIQANIQESVYTVLKDLIDKYTLAFEVQASKLTHKLKGSVCTFKGFREQGAINVKGLEGVDVVWIDEAQSIQQLTLDMLIPTIRKDNAKIFFSMNRYLRSDAVYNFLAGRSDCLLIHINYFENPFCPLSLKHEAETMRVKSERDYNHIYLGEPLEAADDYLFNYGKLDKAMSVQAFGDVYGRQRVMGIDFAAQGNDQCVASILDRHSNVHWKLEERVAWHEPDSMSSIGKIVDLIGKYKPNVVTLDVGGMGHVVHDRLTEIKMQVERFDGGSTQGIDKVHYVNARAEGYYVLNDWFENEYLIIDRKDIEVIKELEKIKMKYRSDGRRIIQPKLDMKKEIGYSPDSADSLMMAVYGAVKYLGKSANTFTDSSSIKRVNKTKRR